MDEENMGHGIYAGIPYMVIRRQGKLYAVPYGEAAAQIHGNAGMIPALEVGDRDPDEVVAAWLQAWLAKQEENKA